MNDTDRLTLIFQAGCFGFFLGVGFCLTLYFSFWIIAPWVRAYLCGSPVSLINVFGMRLRGTPPALIVDAHIALVQDPLWSQYRIRIQEVESAYLSHRHRIHTSDDLVQILLAERQAKKSP